MSQPDKEKYVIIIGAMKSGTTTLFSMLAEHPRISPATPKEPGFFAFEDIYARGFDWYHSLFDFDPDTHLYRLDGSTDYTKSPFITDVWEKMQSRKNAEFKLVYIMRHPLRRLESHARHVQLARKELGQIISQRSDHSLDQGISLPALSVSQYASQIQPYRAAWQAGDLYLTTLEELKKDPRRVMNDLWQFLDIAPLASDASKNAIHANAADQQIRTRPIWDFLSSQSWLMSLGKRTMPKALREHVKLGFRKKLHAEGRFKFSAEEEQMLWQLLEPEIVELERDYKMSLRQLWKQP